MAKCGMKELASPGDADVDIVFVHGLFGSRTNTWSKNGILWPQDLLPADIPNARIMSFGYDADITKLDASQVTNSTMEMHAADLCAALAGLRASTNTVERPIIFVAHSLGGLVCAKALVMGDRTVSDDNASVVARCIQGMVFLGTPFRGSRHAKWTEILQRIVGAFSETNTNKTRDLQENSDKLKELAEAFPDVLRKRDIQGPRIGIAFFIETLKYKKILVVEEDSSWIPGRGDRASIRADHINICKFNSREDEGYRSVVGAIKKLTQMETQGKRSDDGGAIFHNYGEVKNQVGRDQHITGGMTFK